MNSQENYTAMLLQGSADRRRFVPGGFVPYGPYYAHAACNCASCYCMGRYQQRCMKPTKPNFRRRSKVSMKQQPVVKHEFHAWPPCGHAQPNMIPHHHIRNEGQMLPHFFELADVIMRQESQCVAVRDWRSTKCSCGGNSRRFEQQQPPQPPPPLQVLPQQQIAPVVTTPTVTPVAPPAPAVSVSASSSSTSTSSSCWTATKTSYPTCPYIPQSNTRQDSYLQELSQLRWAMKSDVSMQAEPEDQFRIIIDEEAVSPVPWLEIDDSLALSQPDSPPILESQDPDQYLDDEDFLKELRPPICDADWCQNAGYVGQAQ